MKSDSSKSNAWMMFVMVLCIGWVIAVLYNLIRSLIRK